MLFLRKHNQLLRFFSQWQHQPCKMVKMFFWESQSSELSLHCQTLTHSVQHHLERAVGLLISRVCWSQEAQLEEWETFSHNWKLPVTELGVMVQSEIQFSLTQQWCTSTLWVHRLHMLQTSTVVTVCLCCLFLHQLQQLHRWCFFSVTEMILIRDSTLTVHIDADLKCWMFKDFNLNINQKSFAVKRSSLFPAMRKSIEEDDQDEPTVSWE